MPAANRPGRANPPRFTGDRARPARHGAGTLFQVNASDVVDYALKRRARLREYTTGTGVGGGIVRRAPLPAARRTPLRRAGGTWLPDLQARDPGTRALRLRRFARADGRAGEVESGTGSPCRPVRPIHRLPGGGLHALPMETTSPAHSSCPRRDVRRLPPGVDAQRRRGPTTSRLKDIAAQGHRGPTTSRPKDIAAQRRRGPGDIARGSAGTWPRLSFGAAR